MSKEDRSSNSVSLDVILSERGISAKIKLRTVAALDYLLGNLILVPAAKLQAVLNRMEARSDQEIRLIAAETTAAQNILEEDERFGRVLAENYLSNQIKSTANKLEVTRRAIEFLSEDESSENLSPKNVEIEEDWLDCFAQYAERASSERMQDLWARVLAGEIRKPQSFSLATLRFLSELDKEIACLFEREVKCWINGGFILKPEKMENQRLLDLTFLEEVGLLQGVHGNLQKTMSPDNSSIVYWREGRFILMAGTEKKIKLRLIRITRIGREVARILPQRDYVKVLEGIEDKIHKDVSFSQIDLILDEYNGMVRTRPIKVLKMKSK